MNKHSQGYTLKDYSMSDKDLDGKIKDVHHDILKRTKYWNDRIKRLKCYKDVQISEDFKSLIKFKEWYKAQAGFNLDWEVDKDLLLKGNKLYSSDTCILLPKIINVSLTNSRANRGIYPVGVSYKAGKYESRCRYVEDGKRKRKNLGLFNTPEEAFIAYKKFKEERIKDLARQFEHLLDKRAYNALMNYQVEITD